jgi:aminoglycoside phosphotransferase (APT) family kinase protein
MVAPDIERRLMSWFAGQLPDCDDVGVEGIDRVEMGHSAETLLLTISWRAEGSLQHEDVVLRLRPPSPGLLEPYDLKRQFDILRALESTPVRSPRALWFEPSSDVLGREFYVMERLGGTVYERQLPEDLLMNPQRARRMCEAMVEQLAAIHAVDTHTTGLDSMGDGRAYLQRELEHWGGEIQRVQRAPLPALERLAGALGEWQPEQYPTVTLVHGDPKPGNFAFDGGEVSAVVDWEMATLGDPMADLGWAELTWSMPNSIVLVRGTPTVEELVAQYEKLTGFTASQREWHRAFQGFKMAVILLVAGYLFDAGHSDDWRFRDMAYAVHPLTQQALRTLGVDDDLEAGPVLPRKEREAEVQASK